MSLKILLLDGSGTQALPIAKALNKKGYELYSLCAEKYSYGYYTKYVTHRELIPALTETGLKDYILNYVRKNGIDILIPLSDRTAKILSLYREEISEICRFTSPDYEAFRNAYEKNRLMSICKKLGVAHPVTIDLNGDAPFDLSEMKFPALIKPNITTGARGMVIVNSEKEFYECYPRIEKEYGNCHLQHYIPCGTRQIEAQFYIGRDGELKAYSQLCKYRYYPVKAGSSSCSISLENRPDITEQCYMVLKYLGWVGFASFDMIEDPDDLSVNITEINPRIPANIGVVQASGIDFGNMMVDDLSGDPIRKHDYSPNMILRHIGLDLLWFYSSPDRWQTRPNWFRFAGRNVRYQDFSFTDPLPFLFGTYGNLLKQLNPSFRKQKNGTR